MNNLNKAAKAGQLDLVKLLLDRGANAHVYDNSALCWASKRGHTKVVKLLLDHGADVHARDDEALRWASNTEVVKLLKKHCEKSN